MHHGCAFVMAHGGHLWIVITPPNDQSEAVIFNLTHLGNSSDESCIIEPGEHPWVRVRSQVCYGYGQVLTSERWDKIRVGEGFVQYQDADRELVGRIRSGAIQSRYTKPRLREMVRAALSADRFSGD